MAKFGGDMLEITQPCPKYKEVAKALIDGIRDGTYKAFDKLPSESELASKFGASRVTVRQGIKLLEENGLIDRFRGKGSYVVELNEEKKPQRAIEHILLLIIDPTGTHEKYMQLAMDESARLSSMGIALTVSFVSSRDLLQGKYPAILNQDNIGFVLIDGQINEYHAAFIETLKIPYFVIGNHPIPKSVPQVKVNWRKIGVNATRFFTSKLCFKNVVLFVEPLHLFYTRDFVDGYTDVMNDIGLTCNIQLCQENDGTLLLRNMLRSNNENKPFAVIVTDKIAGPLFDIYEQVGVSVQEYPVLILGSRRDFPKKISRQAYFMEMVSTGLLREATDMALKKYKTDWADTFIELCSEDLEITSPT